MPPAEADISQLIWDTADLEDIFTIKEIPETPEAPENPGDPGSSDPSDSSGLSGGPSQPAGFGKPARLELTAKAEAPAGAYTLFAQATVNGRTQRTAAEVYVVKGADEPYTASLLLAKATVNKAKTAGAMVPFTANAAFGNPADGWDTATPVTLYTNYENPARRARVTTFDTALLDSRTIGLKPHDGARSVNNVTVIIGEGEKAANAGKLSIAVSEAYPKITLSLNRALNLFFDQRTAAVQAASADGSKVTIRSVEKAKATGAVANVTKEGPENAPIFTVEPLKAGTESLLVTVELEGYKKPNKNNTPLKLAAKVANAAPKLKLSQTAATFYDDGNPDAADFAPGTGVTISLLSRDAKASLASYGIESVEVAERDINNRVVTTKADVTVSYTELDQDSGRITLTLPKEKDGGAEAKTTGKTILKVNFKDSTKAADMLTKGDKKAVYLPLTVGFAADLQKAVPSSKTKALVVSREHQPGTDIITLPVATKPDLGLGDWYIHSVKDGKNTLGFEYFDLYGQLTWEAGPGSLTLKAARAADLGSLLTSNRDRVFTLNIASATLVAGTPAPAKPRTFAVKLTVTAKAPAMSISLKNKIDVTNPDSAIAATVKLAGTTAEIDTVALYEQHFDGKNFAPLNEQAEIILTESEDFFVPEGSIAGNTFTVKAKPGRLVTPAVKQSLSVAVTLKNGQTVYSWAATTNRNGITTYKDRPLAITPAQAAGKAYQDKKAVTLYEAAPHMGEAVTLDFTNARLGAVKIAAASSNERLGFKGRPEGENPLTANGTGFELIRTAGDQWSIRFKDGLLPEIYAKNGKPGKLKASYTLRLELWAEGAYTLDAAGGPVALTDSNGRAKSKPTLVSVKVNIAKEQARADLLAVSTASVTAGMLDADCGRSADNKTPELKWTLTDDDELPGAYAILMYDTTRPGNGFVHWAVTNIPDGVTGIDKGELGAIPPASGPLNGATLHTNDFGETGYGGPEPPSGTHTYHIYVYALREAVTESWPLDFSADTGNTWQKAKAAFEAHLNQGNMVGGSNIIASGQVVAKYRH